MNTPAEQTLQAGRRARRWVAVLLLVGAVLLVGFAGLFCAATYRPGWYQPAAVDFDRLPEDKQSFVTLLDSISAALNRGESIEIVVDQAQLNRWLAGRHEVFPPEWQRFEPLRDPFVEILPEQRLRLACRIGRGGLAVVGSVQVRLVVEPEAIELSGPTLRAGLLPVSAGWLLERLSDRLPGGLRSYVDDRGGPLRIRNRWIWPNGRRRFRVASLHSEPGRLRIRLEPF